MALRQALQQLRGLQTAPCRAHLRACMAFSSLSTDVPVQVWLNELVSYSEAVLAVALLPSGQVVNVSLYQCMCYCCPARWHGSFLVPQKCSWHLRKLSYLLVSPQPAAQVHNEGGGKRVVVTKNLPGERWLKVLTQLARCAAFQTFTCLVLLVKTAVCAPESHQVFIVKRPLANSAMQVLTAAGCRVEVCTSEDTILDVATIKRLIGKKCDGVIGQLTEARQPLGCTQYIYILCCCGVDSFVHSL